MLAFGRPSERLGDTLLGFAAGAMLFVISNEIIPETHSKGHEPLATSGLMVGLVVMMFLDVTVTA
jgi:ZIP family zinc transporter